VLALVRVIIAGPVELRAFNLRNASRLCSLPQNAPQGVGAPGLWGHRFWLLVTRARLR
jgi:hypothetical protein